MQLGRDSIKNLYGAITNVNNHSSAAKISETAGVGATENLPAREATTLMRHLIRVNHKTGIYAPKIQTKQMTTVNGRTKSMDTTLNKVKNAISSGFRER